MTNSIPPANPALGYYRWRDEINVAVGRVLESGRYMLGPEVDSFEREFADCCDVRFAIGVASGTDALRLALWALGVGRGDEVAVPAHTAVATIAAVELLGAVPRLTDITADTYTMDPDSLAEVCGPKTKAIVPVHLYGHPADMAAIGSVAAQHGIPIVEDCAQAHLSRWAERKVGSIGRMGCFSFYPTKNLAAFGDGGAVVTDDAELAARIRQLREYGWDRARSSHHPGDCSRLDEIQAAVLRVRLRHLAAETEERRQIAEWYTSHLGRHFKVPLASPDGYHVYHLYVVEVSDREAVRDALATRGVGTLVHYPTPVHLEPAYLGRLGGPGSFPVAERACRRVLSLPLYPGLTQREQETVVRAMEEVAQGIHAPTA